MKKIFMFIVIFAVLLNNSYSSESSSNSSISDSVLFSALNRGCSLIIGEIKSINKFESQKFKSTFYNYNTKIIDVIIKGDLNEQKIQNTDILLFAGASYGDKLKIGRRYIMFIKKSIEYDYTWSNRDDIIDFLSIMDKNFLQNFIQKVQNIYKQTDIIKFRNNRANTNVNLPALHYKLINACNNFKKNKVKRKEAVNIISKSKIASYINSPELSSFITYSVPQIQLSKNQIIKLLGKPNIKIGWGFYYLYENQKEKDNYMFIKFNRHSKVIELRKYK